MELYKLKQLYENNEAREKIFAAVKEKIEAEGIDGKGEDGLSLGAVLALIAANYAHSEALAFLFEAGLAPTMTGNYSFTLLHEAAKANSRFYRPNEEAVAATVNLLLDNKVSVLRKDENEKLCCYHYAARRGNYTFVETLAARNCKLDFTDQHGDTGIHIAAEYAKHPVHRLKINEDEIEFQKKHGKEPKILENKIRDAEECRAELENFFKTVKAFAKGGVDINEKNNYGQSALDIAVKSNAKKIAAFLAGTLGEDEAPAAGAIAAGGMTLHQAAEKNDEAAIRAIAQSGADLDSPSDRDDSYRGRTALGIACSCMSANAALALLDCGADPAATDSFGRKASWYFFCIDVRAFLHSGVFENKTIPGLLDAMTGRGFSVDDTVDEDSNTLLLLACKSGRGTGYNHYTMKGIIIDEMLKRGADINISNRFGEKPLMWASGLDFDIMETNQLLLLENGADTSAKDRNGNTALHYAASNDSKTGAKTCAAMLLEFGADAAAANNEGKTALDIATEKDNEPLVKLLLAKI